MLVSPSSRPFKLHFSLSRSVGLSDAHDVYTFLVHLSCCLCDVVSSVSVRSFQLLTLMAYLGCISGLVERERVRDTSDSGPSESQAIWRTATLVSRSHVLLVSRTNETLSEVLSASGFCNNLFLQERVISRQSNPNLENQGITLFVWPLPFDLEPRRNGHLVITLLFYLLRWNFHTSSHKKTPLIRSPVNTSNDHRLMWQNFRMRHSEIPVVIISYNFIPLIQPLKRIEKKYWTVLFLFKAPLTSHNREWTFCRKKEYV